jgi:hypothetical protein
MMVLVRLKHVVEKVNHKNIEPRIFVVVMVSLSLLHIVIHNWMHIVKIMENISLNNKVHRCYLQDSGKFIKGPKVKGLF